ncbi:CDP-diacylglycerol--glycerol-3-phosphate 3-phosphatidyltransferase [Desulfobacca acetoxidans]|uniref:CDP-diacylglycerol--glycerol-3-phosphate 3-phosphatidyltransferase n=1 Tax=Desulfobacca acetoxidans (strain ATCC 700848 / DSM 11109 / ASRB2) TaxID=880072 RepID=F2NDP3_DESAR|nr:CDP-diacylglycerol--glycerol-3-phosphate 3-phosphatidyltransferase [Desulfobacca acetoxidans]AEB10319.1 CDP-diacylglycerol/glycerol-3-phosphate 3-phosphatidyltransferase [Desulfobacca acetoxidans DSM 11109]
METQPAIFWNLPNALTVLRIGAIPVLIALMTVPGRFVSFMAALVFLAAGMTDLLDGFFARRHRLVSRVGKFMDPLADKLLVSAALIMLIPLERIEAWLVFVIIGRELAVTGLRAIAASEGMVMAADRWGKLKTIFQMVALFALILHYPYLSIDFQRLGTVLIWIAAAITVASGTGYFLTFFHPAQSTKSIK